MSVSSPIEGQLNVDDFDTLMHQAVRDRVGIKRYDTWFPNRVRFIWDGAALVVGVANQILQEFIQRSFDESICAVANLIVGQQAVSKYHIDPGLFRQVLPEQSAPKELAKSDLESKPAAHSEPRQLDLFEHVKVRTSKSDAPKRKWRHLTQFVIGSCNRVAFAASTSVVEEPGQGPNPLVLHGPVGTGKTHLLEGIYAAIRRGYPEMRVLFVTAEDFTNRFVTALRFGKPGGFRKHFRGADVLLLDDLHFLAKKKASQEEFLHTLDAMLADGRQVVVTTDCHPRMNDDFQPELLDRLLGGAIWGLLPPDPETRLALLRAKAGERRGDKKAHKQMEKIVAIPDDVLVFLAERLRGNVRELEGALNSLRHFSYVTNRRIDQNLAREALGELFRHAVRVVRVNEVDAAVREVLQLPSGTLQSKVRSWTVSHPRMIAVHLCRKHTAASFGEISQYFGGKSHSGAVAADKTIREWLDGNKNVAVGGREWAVRELIERIERELLR